MTAGRPVLLVVEDEPMIALELKRSLSDAGYEVLGIAATEREATDYAARGGFDCALLDVRLREGTSAALARRLEAAGVPFLVITALRSEDVEDPLLKAAPTIEKPFRLDDLLEQIERLVRKRFPVE